MSGRPLLKLTFSKNKLSQIKSNPSPASTPTPPPAAASTPAPESPALSSGPKLKLKFGPKPPAPPAAAAPSKPKKPAAPKAGGTISKKRSRDVIENEAGTVSARPAVSEGAPVKRIKFSSKPKLPPSIRLRSKGEPPVRPKGVGYDSEASDTEIDPALEEDFILRMQPGDDCEYLRQAIQEKRFGPRSQGGADVSFKPLTRDGRRSTVTIRGRIYAAVLVDLPTIVEAMKSWDKRDWYKAADICQMLIVLGGPIKSEDEARNYPMPNDIDYNIFQYAHGLSLPLRWVRKRRFRKRISNRTIEAVELEVTRLLKADTDAIKPPTFEIIDQAQYMRGQMGEEDGYEAYDDEQDAEGELDEDHYHVREEGIEAGAEEDEDMFEDDLAAEMEAELAAHADANSAPTSATADASHTGEIVHELETEGENEVEVGTPQSQPQTAPESSEDESEESGAEANQDLDEDALEQQRQLQEQREEIAELETRVQAETERWEQMGNPILKSKLGKRVQSLRQALELKKVSIGETDG
ncbi:hypothetical protein FQN57_000369 [Myotisia sp. PD_48]|nr:hypothetical protein FQN57_000369 [Myotisia sp. PD_48]